MGAGLAAQLTQNGASVLTDLTGRSAASVERAESAGMKPVDPAALANCDILLAVLPPAEAVGFALRMREPLANSRRKPLFADCNAVSPRVVLEIERALRDTGIEFADVGIIGLPPEVASPGPRLYASGPGATALTRLNEYGLDVRVLEGPVGTASALKMAYAGISKGFLAVASAMILGATRAGVADSLARELAESDPRLLETLARRIPNMLPKTYRWVEEMRQIGEFLLPDAAAERIFAGAAELFEAIARDVAGDREASKSLLEFARRSPGAGPTEFNNQTNERTGSAPSQVKVAP
jgi:3-hydroxyisobutyrate dehydrogenase-like beta-hydroxyacid dehydrogenase